MIFLHFERRAVSMLPGGVTRLLQRLDDGDRGAVEDLLPLVYDELRALARAQMVGERPEHTLQPTALVHEAWIRLSSKSHPHWPTTSTFIEPPPW